MEHLIGFFGFIFILIFSLVIFYIPLIFFILTIQKALNRCALENQTMSPASAWLLLIPLFNVVWDFIVVTQVANSLEREFRRRNIPIEPAPGKSLGIAASILALCGIIPLLGILCGLAALVCWILYWVKIAGFSNTIAAPFASAPARQVTPV